jgi:S-adenosylmethionine synthetase
MENKNYVENKNKLVTSEFVSYGHPDKIADQIADAILDAYLAVDKNVRTGIEVMVKDNIVVLGGEINSTATINYDTVVRSVFKNLNFPLNHHLTPSEIKIINLIGKQSEEIHSGVDKVDEIGAGDQGFMVGYATNETSVYMPLGHYIAKKICNYVANCSQLGPDTKSQVIIEYDNNNKAIGIHSILVSAMHQCSLEVCRERVTNAIMNNLVGLDKDIYENFIKDKNVRVDVNPCGSWQIGGPISDCGITGRKLVVDSCGGNYSGKDFSKVDRSGAYMARYLAKNIVASGFCDTCRVTLSYMIGVAQPCSVEIDVNRNFDKLPQLKKWILKNIDLTPNGITQRLQYGVLLYDCSKYGHFGFKSKKDKDIITLQERKWENLDLVEDLKQLTSVFLYDGG